MENPNLWKRRQSIETLEELLIAMSPQQHNVAAELYLLSGNTACVVISHDAGYNVYTDSYPVPLITARTAIAGRFIQGKPKWGYTSKSEFTISDRGRTKTLEIRKAWDDYERTQKLEIVHVNHDPGDEG